MLQTQSRRFWRQSPFRLGTVEAFRAQMAGSRWDPGVHGAQQVPVAGSPLEGQTRKQSGDGWVSAVTRGSAPCFLSLPDCTLPWIVGFNSDQPGLPPLKSRGPRLISPHGRSTPPSSGDPGARCWPHSADLLRCYLKAEPTGGQEVPSASVMGETCLEALKAFLCHLVIYPNPWLLKFSS